MTITEFLNARGFHLFEGYSQEVLQQVEDLIQLTNKSNIKVMEIGFNAGHSADVFLRNNSNLTLTSFDLGEHNYGLVAKEFIDITYPNRHTLILGDSRETVPKFIDENKDTKFDVIFIDGGHAYDIATADIDNCFQLAHKDTIVILDDTTFTAGWDKEWTIGPTRAWVNNLVNNRIAEIARKEYTPGRGMSWGKYNFAA